MVEVFDWRRSLCPLGQQFRAGGQALDLGMTVGGVRALSPEPGGRAELFMSFPAFWDGSAARDASWTASRIMNGAIFRVPLWASVQLVRAADLGGAEAGETWASGAAWGTGALWAFDPTADVAAAAPRGSETVEIDLGSYGQVLAIGHVIGFASDGYDFAHEIMDISYDDANVATLRLQPPLRRALAARDGDAGDVMTFRPAMMAVCANASEILVPSADRATIRFASAHFTEALV